MQHLPSIILLHVTKIQGWETGLRVRRQNDFSPGNVNVDVSPYFSLE